MAVPTDAGDLPLSGRRILVVEDEVAISMLLEDMLMDLGCEVVGPAGRLPAALNLARSETVDLALLDVNVAGEPIYPVVDALCERQVPFVFLTGYGAGGIAEQHRDRPVLPKPFSQFDLERALKAALPPG